MYEFSDIASINSIQSMDKISAQKPYANPNEVKYKINADAIRLWIREECYRELMVSYFQIIPLLENEVAFDDADYILFMHCYARCDDMSSFVLQMLRRLNEIKKPGAKIIVLGKAANAEKLLNGETNDFIFLGDHFAEKLGKMFGMDLHEKYFVYDERASKLSMWPVDGCLQKCKFCRRCFMHIKFESLSLEHIKTRLDYLQANFPETLRKISLRAENLTEYGIDIYGTQMLHKLIELIASYDEVESIELPIGISIGEITPEILNAICNCPKIKRISMNMEAGTDRLLQLIGKKHTCEQALTIISEIKSHIPDVFITTTVMIGLPTETFDDIQALAYQIVNSMVDDVLVNYYVESPNHLLANYPQMSNSLKEYHLKMLLKWLKVIGIKPKKMTLTCYYVRRKPYSRKHDYTKMAVYNQKCKQFGYLPRHYGTEYIITQRKKDC